MKKLESILAGVVAGGVGLFAALAFLDFFWWLR